jgi:hypothetical protein
VVKHAKVYQIKIREGETDCKVTSRLAPPANRQVRKPAADADN